MRLRKVWQDTYSASHTMSYTPRTTKSYRRNLSIGYSMTIPPGASVQAELFRANDTGGTPFNPAPPSVYDKTFSTTQLHGLGSLDDDGNAVINQTDQISPQNGQNLTTQELFRLRLTLVSNQQVNPAKSPEVRAANVTVEGTYTKSLKTQTTYCAEHKHKTTTSITGKSSPPTVNTAYTWKTKRRLNDLDDGKRQSEKLIQ